MTRYLERGSLLFHPQDERSQGGCGEKRGQDFRENSGGIVGHKWARRSEPQRGDCDATAGRRRSQRRGKRRREETSTQIKYGLRQHNCEVGASK